MLTLRSLRALAIDMDGVLYKGNTAQPGAAAFVRWLRERRFPFVFLTNNSTLDAQAYERKLASLGIEVPADQILTSATVTADYLARNYPPHSRVFIIGESGLEREIAARGLVISDNAPQIVVVGLDRQVNYAKLRTAALAIRAGACFVASNPDPTLPTEVGEIPGAGAIVAALATATGRTPIIIGKPERPMMEMALARLGEPRELTAMLGDRVDTDIAGGQRAGMPTILVLSGVTKEAPSPSDPIQPTWVFAGLPELMDAWRQSLEMG